jgi:hypothetical protein
MQTSEPTSPSSPGDISASPKPGAAGVNKNDPTNGLSLFFCHTLAYLKSFGRKGDIDFTKVKIKLREIENIRKKNESMNGKGVYQRRGTYQPERNDGGRKRDEKWKGYGTLSSGGLIQKRLTTPVISSPDLNGRATKRRKDNSGNSVKPPREYTETIAHASEYLGSDDVTVRFRFRDVSMEVFSYADDEEETQSNWEDGAHHRSRQVRNSHWRVL